MGNGNSDKIKELIDKIDKHQKDMLQESASIAKDFFIDSFKNKGFEDDSFEQWEDTKKEVKIGSLLERTGNLKSSIQIKEVTDNSATISADASYAKFVNDGTSRMVSRKFMGSSAKMEKKIIDNLKSFLDKLIK